MRGANRILLVDDDADIRDTLSEFLQDEGYEVLCAQNGREALEHLRRPPSPCVILLDLSMPVMDGLEFRVEQMKDPSLAAIPVVIVTAGKQLRDVPAELPVVPKPPNLDKLMSLIRRYCVSAEH